MAGEDSMISSSLVRTEDVTVASVEEDTSAVRPETTIPPPPTTAAAAATTTTEEEEELAVLILPSSENGDGGDCDDHCYCYDGEPENGDCCTTTSSTMNHNINNNNNNNNGTPTERDELLTMECGVGRRSFGNEDDGQEQNEEEEEDGHDNGNDNEEGYIDEAALLLSSSSSSSSSSTLFFVPSYCSGSRRGMDRSSWNKKNRTITRMLFLASFVVVVMVGVASFLLVVVKNTSSQTSNSDNILDDAKRQHQAQVQAQAQAQIFRGPPSPTKITRPSEGETPTFTSNKNSDDNVKDGGEEEGEEHNLEDGYIGGYDDDDDVHSSESSKFTNSNKFFDTVLPWKKQNKKSQKRTNNRINEDTSSATDGDDEDNDDTVWYEGALEFCSNEDGTSYAYGLPGHCTPGSPAPLIRIYPKHHYRLTLINTADIDTNLHTHGLHISGVGNVDDVTRNVQPGHCLVYEYYLLEDSDVGTFWYHPHRHPLVSRSAYGGAYGLLVVDENPVVLLKYYPPHLQNFLSQNTDNEILLQFSSMLSPDKKHRYNRINGLERDVSPDLTTMKSNQTSLIQSTPTPPLTIVIKPDTYYRARISAVVYSDSVNYVEFLPHDACDFISPIAYDGVYRSEIPHPNNNSPKHMLTVSSRLDVALRCQQDVDIYFHQGQKDLVQHAEVVQMVHVHVVSKLGKDDDKETQNKTTGKVVDLTNPTYPSSPFWDEKEETTWSPRRPYYMPDLTNEYQVGQSWVDDTWTVSMDDYFTNGTKAVSVNQVVWDPSVAARSFDLNDLVEWNLLRTQSHPFHAHINRMQIVQPGGCGHRYEVGQYYDTITADTDECLVRMKFFDYAGRIVIHCHRFGHEDKGMMTWIDVLGGHGHGVSAEPQVDCPFLP